MEIVAGIVIVIVAVPGIGVATLALIIGISFIVGGIAMAALGWDLRRARRALPT